MWKVGEMGGLGMGMGVGEGGCEREKLTQLKVGACVGSGRGVLSLHI